MTDLENFVATVERRRPGRILYHGDYVDDLRRRVVEHIGTKEIAKHYGYDWSVGIGPRRPGDMAKPDYSRYWREGELPAGTRINESGVAMVPSGFYHFWGYVSPLRKAESLAEIEEYPLEDVSRYDWSGMRGEVEKAHAAGKVADGSVGHMYESAWQIRGYEQFLMDTIERPDWAGCLLERLFQRNLVKARELARAGVDLIRTGDDVANQRTLMFRKETWRTLVHSRWAKVYAEIKSISPRTQIHYHSDGNVMEIVPDLIEAGVDILNPLQPECLDVDEVHRRYGRRVSFDGTIGTQSTMPFGTAAEVRARVKEVIEKYGRKGGLIIGPTHVLEPEVPIDNIEALFGACREYGTFE